MTTAAPDQAQQLHGLVALPLDQVHPSPNNPRERLTDIDGLALSIRENGLIQPIVVQSVPGQRGYQILAGHRRFAAVRKLGWTKVPAILRRDMLPDEELLAMLVENGQRTDLDPIEEARALKRLCDQGFTKAQVARKIGRSDAHVVTRIQLLSLPLDEQEELRAKQMTIRTAVEKGRIASGRLAADPKKRKKITRGWYFDHTHTLASNARARCMRLEHNRGRRVSGGEACGECWESVIRADERNHLHTESNRRGRCVLCDTAQQDLES